ncbi:Ig-like domain repeat protein [Telmatobacter sp. DSM 110680]|uniref:Ig-like domain repeat protein n=1 Tax=Telmatobacter sp. DSM 110680 TaxID=3036704 RepID=A0AAU7DJC2_9BACT
MRPLNKLACLCLTPLLVIGVSSVAQNTASKPLITEKVNESQLVTLKGNTPPPAIAANDRGLVSANLPMTGMILVLQRSPEQQAAFDAFVASQYDPTSPNYHRWLEPSEVGEKFGPALTDITTVSSWLTGHGFSVDEVSKDRMTIRFSGSAAQVQDAFHTEIHNLLVKGVPHISNMRDPQIPMALESVVLGPKALHDFIPRPLHRAGAAVKLNRETGRWERIGEVSSNVSRPRTDIGFTSSNGPIEDVAPYDFATIYNILPLWNAATPIDGTGQTIAIAGRSDVKSGDVSQFRSTFGLSGGGAFNTIHNGADPGVCTSTSSSAQCTLDDQIENALDVEWSGAVAKRATIDLVVTQQVTGNDAIYDSAQYVINNKTASIINVSYGLCELFEGTSGNTAYNNLWQSAATAGIAVFVAAGDSGSPSCDQGGDSAGTPYPGTYGLTVSGIASSAYDTAVGGTDFNWGSSAAPYWNTTNSSNGSTAAGYVPETPWNDSCTNPLLLSYTQSIATYLNNHGVTVSSPTNAESSCNLVEKNWAQLKALSGIDVSWLVDTAGGSGGASNCTSSDGSTIGSCTGGYAKPSWQSGVTGIPNDNKRDIPDVSFFAGAGLFGSAYIICVSDNGTCDTSASSTTEPTGEEFGGTSVGSPAMAGVMALINQKAGSAQGNPNSALYTLAGKQTYSSCSAETVTAGSSSCYFNDIDTGTNAMPCAAGSPNCTVSTGGDTVGVVSGYSGAVGYDGATGLGTLNVANVVNSFAASSTGTATASVGVVAVPSTFTAAQGTAVTVTVTGASGTPTGTVVLTSGTFASATKSLSSGSVTFNLSPGLLAVGTDTIKASYSGDATYASANGTTTVTVTPLLAPTVTVTPAAASINSGQSLNVTAAVAGAGGTPTGTVTLSGGGYTSSAQSLVSGSATISVPANSLSAGTDTLTVTYNGDSSFSTATGTATVTVTQSTYTLAATTPASINRGSPAASTITWTTTNNYSANVTLGTCTLNAGSPSNSAADTPKCTVSSTAFGSSGSGTATVSTAAATTAALKRPAFPGAAYAGSSAILALMVFFGIPARRRSWRAMLGVFLLIMTLGSLAACGGGGGSSGGGGGTSDPGTASGKYVFTVNATGSDAAKTTATTTFTVTVN